VSIAESLIRKRTLVWPLCIALLILGWLSYADLPRLEEPSLTVREAWVITPYPGASAAEVEEQVSAKIERAARGLDPLAFVDSYSSRGLSVVRAHVQHRYDEQVLPPIWDELRHLVDDLQRQLPPGAGPSTVNDRLGDRYSASYALVGEGFTPGELGQVAEMLRRGLGALEAVEKVDLFGKEEETLFVEVSTSRAKALGVAVDQVLEALRGKDLPADAGRIPIGPELVSFEPAGLYRSEEHLRELMIAPAPDRLVRLGDISEVRLGYQDPPPRLLRLDGRPAVGIAAAGKPDADPIALGEAVQRRVAELTADIPLGMELKIVALEQDDVAETSDEFNGYFIQASAILITTLLLFMGLRSGLLVTFLTLLTLAAVFVIMDRLRIPLDRISLGALVITLGLIPGNAILVVEDIKARLSQGVGVITAAWEAVARNALPLLGATAVATLAFAPIGGMAKDTGDYVRPLFLVVLIGLPLSWVTAVTLAPLLADRFLASGDGCRKQKDPLGGPVHGIYTRILDAAIRYPWVPLGASVLLILLSLYGLGFVRQAYFAPSDSPRLLVEVQFRAGTHIRDTERWMNDIQTYLRGQEGVLQVATAIGAGHSPYLAGSRRAPELGLGPGGHFAASLVSIDDSRRIDAIGARIQTDLERRFPDAVVVVKRQPRAMDKGGSQIQLRLRGPDPVELRRLADQAKALIAADPAARAVRDDWGPKVKVARPLLAGELARRLGIDRAQIATALRTTYSGTRTGFLPKGTELVPIVVRAQEGDRRRIADMGDIQVISPLRGDRISLNRLVERLDTLTEDARRFRHNGLGMITVHADVGLGSAFELLRRIKPRLEEALGADAASGSSEPGRGMEIPLKGRPGYSVAWGGEAEGLAESRAELGTWLPLCGGLTLLILIALLGDLRRPLIVLLTVPLPLIGVTGGLLLTGYPFDFMALLGLMGLPGLVMKQAILLVKRIDLQMSAERPRPSVILQAAGRCLHPLGLGAGATLLTLLPLLRDSFFASTAATLMSGLAFAIPWTLVMVPALYAILLRARDGETPR
jgi:multidrug efflux pump subunit AcrB